MSTKCTPKSITVEGIEYVPASQVNLAAEIAASLSGWPYVIVRTLSAGVFAGYLVKREGQEVELVKARRFWYWSGAASLSQLAIDGVAKPNECKFPAPVTVTLLQAVEILAVSRKAQESIEGVKVWQV